MHNGALDLCVESMMCDLLIPDLLGEQNLTGLSRLGRG